MICSDTTRHCLKDVIKRNVEDNLNIIKQLGMFYLITSPETEFNNNQVKYSDYVTIVYDLIFFKLEFFELYLYHMSFVMPQLFTISLCSN